MKKLFRTLHSLFGRISLSFLVFGMIISTQSYSLAQISVDGGSTLNANGSWSTPSGWAHAGIFQNAAATAARFATPSATATISNGSLVSIAVVNGGGGFLTAPTVALSGGGGSGAVATAIITNGIITGFNITNGGSNYSSAPTVTIANSGAVGSVNIVSSGLGYTSAPRVTFSGGGGSGAAALTTLSPNGAVASIVITNPGSGYTGNPTVTIEPPVPGGVASFITFNNDITADRVITLDGNRVVGQLTLGDLSGTQIYTFDPGANGGSLTFDSGLSGGGNSYFNKFQGGNDVINADVTLEDQLNARVTSGRVTITGALSGNGSLTSTGNGVLALTGDSSASSTSLQLWNRGTTNTNAQVELGATVGNAIGGDITVGNATYGTAGHAVLQLLQGRTNLDQIKDSATLTFDSFSGSGRNNYFKLMGGSETVGRILDIGSLAVIENREGETSVSTPATLTVGGSLANPVHSDSIVTGFIRDGSGNNQQQADASGGQTGAYSLGLTKNGDGTLTLRGGNIIYTGQTTVNSGTLVLDGTTNFRSDITNNGAVIFNVASGTTWNFVKTYADPDGAGSAIAPGSRNLAVTGTGSVTKTGAGTFALHANQSISGLLTTTNGTLNLFGANAGSTFSGGILVAGDSAVNRNLNLRGQINLTGGLNATGRFNNTGSTVNLRGTVFTTSDPEVADGSAFFQEGVLNMNGGSITINNTDFLLDSGFTSSKTAAAAVSNSTTISLNNTASLVPGMRLAQHSGAVILSVDYVNRRVTLNQSVTISNGATLDFTISNNTDGRITGTASDITLVGRPNAIGTAFAGRLLLDNEFFSNNTNRVPNSIPIVSKGGAIEFRNDASAASFSETLGNLVLNQGHLQVIGYRAADTRTSTLTFNNLTRSQGSVVEFAGRQNINNVFTTTTDTLGTDQRNRILFTSAPTLDNGIIGGWAFAGNEWVKYSASTGVTPLVANDYKVNSPTTWVAIDNVKLTAGQTLDARRAINSLNVQGGHTLNLNGQLLSVETGGILTSGGNVTISGGGLSVLTVGAASNQTGELITNVNTNQLTISAPIQDFEASQNITTSANTSTVTLVGGRGTAGLLPGMTLTGDGITPGTVILTVDSATQVTVSKPIPTSLTNVPRVFTGGSVALTKAGTGLLILSSTNSYTGKTIITNGTVRISSVANLGTAPSSLVSNQIQLNGGTLQLNASLSLSENQGITVGEAGGRIELGTANSDTFVGNITAPVFATGVLELAPRGDSSNSSNSVINLGKLDGTSMNFFGGGLKTEGGFDGLVNVYGNNTIGGVFMLAGEMVLHGNNNITGDLNVATGDVTLNGSNTYKGSNTFSDTITVNSGSLRLNHVNALGSGGLRLNLGNGAQVLLNGVDQTIREITGNLASSISNSSTTTDLTLTFDLLNNQTFAGSLEDGDRSIGLIKRGPGRLTLNNNTSNFSGVIRVEEGVLDVTSVSSSEAASALGASISSAASRLVLNGGGLSFSLTGLQRTDRSFTLGAGPDAGTLIANGNTQNARIIFGVNNNSSVSTFSSSAIAFVGEGPRTLTLSGVNTGDNTFNLQLGDRSPSEPSSLLKIGPGNWLLGKESNYSGSTTILEGILGVISNNTLGTTTKTTSVTSGVFTGDLPNGTIVSFPRFSGTTVPGGITSNQPYYVINSNAGTFQISATPGGSALNLTSNGSNVRYVADFKTLATTIANPSNHTFVGKLPNGTPIVFNTQSQTGVAAALPTGISANVTYYVINSDGNNFQVAAAQNSSTPVTFTTTGGAFYYNAAVDANNSAGVNLAGGRMDLRNVNYSTPETLKFTGGSLNLPIGSNSTWAGNFDVAANANITLGAGSSLTLTGNLIGNRGLTQLGEGVVIMQGENISPSTVLDNSRRFYTVQAGTLKLDYTNVDRSKLVDNATLTLGGGRRGGVLVLTGNSNSVHEEIINNLSLQAGANKIFRESGSNTIRLNAINRNVGSSLYFDLARIAKTDTLNMGSNSILGGWAIIRDALVQPFWIIPGTVSRTVTVNTISDSLTSTSGPHFLANGTPVRLSSTSALPSPLNGDTTYYAIGVSSATVFKVSAVPFGPAIDLITDGSGGTITFATDGPEKRAGLASLIFTANTDNDQLAGGSGNGKIRVAIVNSPASGPITSTISGQGTIASPYLYTITTTANTNSTNALFTFVNTDPNAGNIITLTRSGTDATTDLGSYGGTGTFLSGGSDDNGNQDLGWARNVTNLGDGFVTPLPNSSYSTGFGSNVNTNVVLANNDRPDGTITNTIRFSNNLPSVINFGNDNLDPTKVNVIQTGAVLVSPTVGANDTALNGAGELTTENQGNLQNFIFHQYNELGDLTVGAPIVDRSAFTKVGHLTSANRRLITGLERTDNLAVGMTVTEVVNNVSRGTIAEIRDMHTIVISVDHLYDGSRREFSFENGFRSFGTYSNSDRRRINGVFIAASGGVGGTPSRLSISDLYIGMPVKGAGIPAGATISGFYNDFDIQINVDHFFVDSATGSTLTFTPSIGVEKLGGGTLVLSGQNRYTSVTFIAEGVLRAQTLTDGGVAGSLGASSAAAGNLTFNGGTLQYVGNNSSTNRGLTLTDLARIEIGHERTVASFLGSISGTDTFEKAGSGTLEMRGNAGLSDLRIEEGTLRIQLVDTNPSPGTFSQSNFVTNGLTSVRLAGGKFEVRGTEEGNVSQTFGGQLYLEEGATEVRAISRLGYDPNNLAAGPVGRSTTVTFMGGEELTSVVRTTGSTVRFVEEVENGSLSASILINGVSSDRGGILPWAVFQTLVGKNDIRVSDHATISLSTGSVNAASNYDSGSDPVNPNTWYNRGVAGDNIIKGLNLDASEGFSSLLTFSGTLSLDRSLNTMRYLSNFDSTIQVPQNTTLQILSGSLLVAYDVRNANKQIIGAGNISGGGQGIDGRDLIIHQYNQASPFTIGANVVDDTSTVQANAAIANGSRELVLNGIDVPIFNRLRVGAKVTGPGIPAGTTIIALDSFGRRVTLSNTATVAGNSNEYKFTDVTSFVQAGVGTTILSGTNTYTGKTYVHGGVLRLDSVGAVPGGINTTGGTSRIVIEGGVLGLGANSGDFLRSTGTTTSSVEFKGSGGFAAYASDKTVNLGGLATPGRIRYGNNSFVPDGSSFVLGSHDATHKVSILNPIDLGSYSQVVRVDNGPAAIEGQLSGALSGLGRLIKFGLGSLRLSASNTHTGGIEIAEGRLVVANVNNVFGAGTAPVRLGDNRTNTSSSAALELEIEGGTNSKKLEVSSVNSRGVEWRGNVQTDSSSGDLGSHSSMAIVNGNPAIAYYDATNGDLKYVRAADSRGDTWQAPVLLAERGDVGRFVSLSVINGNPAVSYYDATNQSLVFIRSTDVSGVVWGAPIIADSAPVNAVAVQANGQIVVGGTFTRLDGQTRTRLARLNENGSLDSTFNVEVNGEVRSIVIQNNQQIIIGGTFTKIGTVDRNRIARLNSDGSLDTSYNPNLNGDLRVMVLQPDGNLLIGGSFTSVQGQVRNRIARLNSSGTVEEFNPNANGEVRAIAYDSLANRVLFGGAFTSVNSVTRNRLARVDINGVLDGVFNPNVNGEVRGLAVRTDAKIYVGGIFGAINGTNATSATTRNRLALLNDDGTLDFGFTLEVDNEVRALHLQPDQKLVILGVFTTLGDQTIPRLGRLNADGSLDLTFMPDPDYEVRGVAQSGTKLVLGGVFSNVGGGTQQWVGRLDSAGVVDPSFARKVDNLGQYSSLISVGGNPAIAYHDGVATDLRYVRATDVNGASWGSSLVLDASANDVGKGISMKVANIGGDLITRNAALTTISIGGVANIGTPAIAYYDATSRDLKYILSNNAAGTEWSTPLLIQNAGNVGSHLSLQIVNGFPAVAYYNESLQDMFYVRALNVAGLTHNLRNLSTNEILTLPVGSIDYRSAWGTPVPVDDEASGESERDVGQFLSLEIVNGQPAVAGGLPAIAYYDNTNADLRYIRASDVSGNAWTNPAQVLQSLGDVGKVTSLVMVDGVPGISYYDATNGDLKYVHLTDAAGYSRVAFSGNSTWSGEIALDGNAIFSPASGQTANLTGAITGAAGFTMAGEGILNITNLSGPNNFATQSGGAVIRYGQLQVGSNGALGTGIVGLGDVTPKILTVARASVFGTLLTSGGRFDDTHDGEIDNPAQNIGAFVEIGRTIDGRTFTPADAAAGVLVLVKDESGNAHRNGVYRVIFTNDQLPGGLKDGTMNLGRAPEMDSVAELAYGTQVRVSGGTHTGQAFYIASRVTDLNVSEVHFLQDSTSGTLALLANTTGLTIDNTIHVNAIDSLNGAQVGTSTMGAIDTITSGTVNFSGNVILQNLKPGIREERTVNLASSITSGSGVTFSGSFSEVNGGAVATLDSLQLQKTGPGIVTLSGSSTHHGGVDVSEGTLLVMNTTGSATGTGLVAVKPGAVLGGTGIIAGAVTLLPGTPSNKSYLRPGDPNSALNNTAETLTINQTLTVNANSVVEFSLGATNFTKLATNTIEMTPTGQLLISLQQGYMPAVNDAFEILTWNTLSNASSDINLLDNLLLPGAYIWETTQAAGKLSLKVLGNTEGVVITADPISRVVDPGTNGVTFSVTVTGTNSVSAPIVFVWTKDGVPIPSATTNTLTLNNVSESDEGVYAVSVSNGGGLYVDSSTPASLTVNDPPVIVTQPAASQTVNPGVGSTVTFSVSATTTSGTLSYQWRKGLTNIPGATNSTYTISPVAKADEGIYTVVVRNHPTNPLLAVVSNNSSLFVNNPVSITTQPQATVTASDGDFASFSVEATGGGTLSYQWERNTGSGFQAIQDATFASYTTPAPVSQADNGHQYRVIVSNGFSSETSQVSTLTISFGTPTFTEQPKSKTIVAGSTLTLQVGIGGSATNRTIQWKRNNVNIVGATSATLTIPNILITQAGEFSCEVKNSLGKTLSSKAQVVIVSDPKTILPVELNKTATIPVLVQGSAAALKNVLFLWKKDGEVIAKTRVTGNTTKTLTVKLAVAEGTDSDTGTYTCEVTGPGGPGDNIANGGTHYLRVFNAKPVITPLPIVFPMAMIGDDFEYQIPVSDSSLETPTTYAAAGLPPGLKLDVKTGKITGRPTATKVGGYLVKLTASNIRGKSEASQTLMVQAVPGVGVYAGIIARNNNLNSGIGGRFDLTVAAAGTFTGKLILGTFTHSFTGRLNLDATNAVNPNATVNIKRTVALGGPQPIDLSFEINPTTNRLENAQFTSSGTTLSFTAWRNVWSTANPANSYRHYYTVALGVTVPQGVDANTIPQGDGYMSFTPTATGTLTLAGKTADGQGITGAQFIGPAGEIVVFQTLYLTNPKGSLLGQLNISTGASPVIASDNVVTGTLSWSCPPSTVATNRLYKAGFGPVELTAVGGAYVPPTSTVLLLELATGSNNARLEFNDPTLTDNVGLIPETTVSVTTGNKITVLANAAKTRLTAVVNSGAFSGGFTLVDSNPRLTPPTGPNPVSRAITFQGLIVRTASGLEGRGYFLLPGLPSDTPLHTSANSPIVSRQALFLKNP